MSQRSIGPLAQAWYRWKALRLPWRKRFLVGFDLQGNTYWEFRLTTRGPGAAHDPTSATSTHDPGERWRRIVKYPRSTHYSSVKVSPLWHQWLRYTRPEPPTLQEQRDDVVRQARMKQLAAAADARWEAKPKVMEDGVADAKEALPENTQTATEPTKTDTTAAKDEAAGKTQQGIEEDIDPKDPWKKARASGPGETWQPTAWTPTGKK